MEKQEIGRKKLDRLVKEKLKDWKSIYDITLELNNKVMDIKLYNRIRYRIKSYGKSVKRKVVDGEKTSKILYKLK